MLEILTEFATMTVKYYYGWKPSLPDIRDERYQWKPPTRILAALPPKWNLVDPLPPAPFTPAWDQGAEGSCGPHTAAGDILFSQLIQQHLSAHAMPSRRFIYYITQMVMGTLGQDSGVTNRDLLKALARYGYCDESICPYVPGQYRNFKPSAEAFTQAAERKIIEYNPVAQNLDDMRACIASGDPFIFGFSVYNSMETAEVARTGVVPFPRNTDYVVGGHDVLLVAYNDASQQFMFRNSWSPQWGVQGYGFIPYSYATHPRLAQDFWTVRKAPFPAPQPPQPPSPPVPPPEPSKRRVTFEYDDRGVFTQVA